MLFFSTLFDINYVSRGLCLIGSLNKVLGSEYKIFVLALDDEVVEYFINQKLDQVIIIKLSEAESFYPELNTSKKNRSLIEYYFTLSPILPLYILENYIFCDRITSLDADLYFFSSPGPFFKSLNNDKILITPHDFSSNLLKSEKYGKFNVSFQSFPNTSMSLKVLKDWKNKCLEWCKDELDVENNRYADQKYLDKWEETYENIIPINQKNFGRAPWNISDTELCYKNSRFFVGHNDLIYYHFHHLRINDNLITHGLNLYDVKEINNSIKKMYSIYILNLKKIEKNLELKSDSYIERYKGELSKNLIKKMWRLEQGAYYFFGVVYFFKITIYKDLYNSLIRKLNG